MGQITMTLYLFHNKFQLLAEHSTRVLFVFALTVSMVSLQAANKLSPLPSMKLEQNMGSLKASLINSLSLSLAQKFERSPADFQIEIDSLTTQPVLDIEAKGQVQILGGAFHQMPRLDGVFSFPIMISNAKGFREFNVTGVLRIVGPALVAARNLRRGDVISAADLSSVKMPWRLLPAGAAGLLPASLLGLGMRSMVMAGSPLTRDMLDEPMDIKSGDLVEITVISGPGVMIRSRAVARQEGRKGDLIRLVQPETKKNLQGQVTGPKSVEVQL